MADVTPCEKAPSTGPLPTKKRDKNGDVLERWSFVEASLQMYKLPCVEGCCCIVDAIYMYFTEIQ